MRSPISILSLSLLLFACGSSDDSPNSEGIPSVYQNSSFEVLTQTDLVYAEGLSHQSLNSQTAEVLSLKLDVYSPNNDDTNRPAFVFIHGGGFSGGSKQQAQIIEMAQFFATRGWVFFSVDYRLLGDIGTVPQEWIDYTPFVPAADANQFLSIYPAIRDAKAAMRWVVAHAEDYGINKDYISVGGGSAGAVTAIALGVTESSDYRDEIPNDPTLSTTNLDTEYEVKTIIDFWGSGIAVEIIEIIYGQDRFDSNDPPLLIAHGTADPTVLYEEALSLKETYEGLGLPLAFYPFEGAGHGVWNQTVDGKRLEELAFDFIIEQQSLLVK